MIEVCKDLLGVVGGILVAVILTKNHYRARVGAAVHRWIDRAVVVIASLLIAETIGLCVYKVADPQAWDYPLFYTVAKTAASGRPFYRPDVLRKVFSEVRLTTAIPDDWVSQVNGYWYLPPSALLLAPLGLLNYTASLTVHYVIQLAFFFGSAALLHRMVPIRRGWRGLLELIVLMLSFRPVQDAFSLAQIVFGALFFLTVALFMLGDRPALAGVALGLGFLYKPLLLIVAALTPFARKRSAAAACLATLAAAAVAGALAFGIDSFTDFARYGPSYNPARFYFSGPLNQSLFPVTYRLLGLPRDDLTLWAALFAPRFALLAAAFTLITVALCRREFRNPAASQLKMALIISGALLVYPQTLYNTIPLILPVFFIVYACRDRLPVAPWAIIGFVVVQYALASIKYSGAFPVLLSSWLSVAILLSTLPASGAELLTVSPEVAV